MDDALRVLQDAVDGLEKRPAPKPDRSALQKLYGDWKDVGQGDYTDSSWKDLQAALQTAKDTLNDTGADQAKVDDALRVLRDAVDGLEKRPAPKPDRSALQKLYGDWKDVGQGEYTDSSWKALQAALKKAEDTLNDPDADQAKVDDALRVLQDAVDGLRKENGTSDPTDSETNTTGGQTTTDTRPGDTTTPPPSGSDNPVSGSQGGGRSPQTGDAGLPLGLLVVTVLSAGGLCIAKKKK